MAYFVSVYNNNIKTMMNAILAFFLCFSMASNIAYADYRYKLSMSEGFATSRVHLRVKIFPHEFNYKPHGKDTQRDRFTIQSDLVCQVFKGQNSKAAKSNTLLYASRNIEIRADKIQSPLWIECPGVWTLVRKAPLPSFTYAGGLYVRAESSKNGALPQQLEAINTVSLESYTKGVVPSEVYTHWPMETLKTQAVAARTYAAFHHAFSRRYMRGRLWDVDDTIAYQAYTGLSMRNKKTDQAVDATKSIIITYQGDMIQAYYHADSGGITENARHVWNADIPFTKSRKELFHGEMEPTKWRNRVSLERLTRKLARRGLVPSGTKVTNLAVPVAGRTPSDRVKVVSLELSNSTYQTISIGQFKSLVGSLPSTLFYFENQSKSTRYVNIRGFGSGHGVGMSQRGAEFLADAKGWSFDKILSFYYLDTELCKIGKRKVKSPTEFRSCIDVVRDRYRKDEDKT